MKTRNVDRFHVNDYIRRAQECKNSMERAYENSEWNACVIMAVHCAIAAADAYCIFKKGMRNASDNHSDSINLFLSTDPHDQEVRAAVQHLAALISIKSGAEYGEKLSAEKEAEQAKKHAGRLFDFVYARLK
ncbi:HEPN domain-containing protein [Candidatus Micrarchaeota archaeon]|nr:HEPN domain-containing protein [Candidatus Micrarchaeota archaeon]